MNNNSNRAEYHFSKHAQALASLLEARLATIAVIGLGYVGLPMAIASVNAGFRVVGFDINEEHIARLASGQSSIGRITGEQVVSAIDKGRLSLTSAAVELGKCDVIIICVPTPLDRHREPDLSYIIASAENISKILRPAQLISLESTTYPGTTREVVKPILETGGLTSGEDFFLCFSPEREDPGNVHFHTASIPKVVGADGKVALSLASSFYGSVVERIVAVESCEIAEAVKLTENIFRSVNIALVNELKIVFDKMGINIWNVIDAAKTKPFGYMPFYPGPGLGGHCIPIDPFYLAWKAREFDTTTRFIELAGEINTRAPYLVIEKLIEALSLISGRALNGANILLCGIAYKKNVEDTRESPAFKLIELIEKAGGIAAFHDPFVPVIPPIREHPEMAGRASVALTATEITKYDAILISTNHDNVDYELIAAHARIVVDTRNAMGAVAKRENIVLA